MLWLWWWLEETLRYRRMMDQEECNSCFKETRFDRFLSRHKVWDWIWNVLCPFLIGALIGLVPFGISYLILHKYLGG